MLHNLPSYYYISQFNWIFQKKKLHPNKFGNRDVCTNHEASCACEQIRLLGGLVLAIIFVAAEILDFSAGCVLDIICCWRQPN